MGRSNYRVIDADGHIFESPELYRRFLDEGYLDPEHRDELREMLRAGTDPQTGQVWTPLLWTHRSSVRQLDRTRALGGVPPGEDRRERGEGRKPGTRAAQDVLDPALRLLDMDEEGIDVAVVFPSALIGFCALDDARLEAALYRAYNRFMHDFCSHDPARLRYVAVVSMRDVEAGAGELARVAREATAVGLYTQTHMDGKQLDHPDFSPLWERAQAEGLAIAVHHGSAGLPPWGLGVFEMGGSWFQQHASVFVYEQMRAVAVVLGGGLTERYPELTFAFLEAGCGWLPFWLERLDEHYALLPQYVPLLARRPSEAFLAGRCFVSFEPDEVMLPDVVEALGDAALVYASDYPHFDCRFPDSVRLVAEHGRLTEATKARVLGENPARLYPRIRT